MSTINVYKMNDCEWWAGESLEACAEEAKSQTGLDGPGTLEDERQYPAEGYGQALNDEAMTRLMFVDFDGPEQVQRTFAEQLAKEIADGTRFPCLFASTEY